MKTAAGYAQAMVRIADHLVQATGADSQSLDAHRLHWVIEARCRHLQMEDAAAYAYRVTSSTEELDTLIDVFVVPETRFFRDSAVFNHLLHWLPQMAAAFPGALRILSAPCSTGQEAYSIAAVLQLAGIPPARFSIDAFDISVTALTLARRGLYPAGAMRHVSPNLQQACGVFEHGHWKMHDALRERIRFEARNLARPGALTPQLPATDGKYHLILCRNLFIYLCQQARAALVHSLASALVPGGRLVIGTADCVGELNDVFVPQKPASSFAFTHRQQANPASTRQDGSLWPGKAASGKTKAPSSPKRIVRLPSTEELASPSSAEPAASSATSLYQSALQHHNQGNHRKAEHRCRQALYLNPGHLPALELLATLWIEHPNMRIRRALEARISRNRLACADSIPFNGSFGEWAEGTTPSRKDSA